MNIPTEHEEQATFVQWVNHYLNGMDAFIFAIPNGGHRHKGVARKLKEEGVKPGVPDLFLAHARLGYHGLFIEMKRSKGGKVTREQARVILKLRKQGYKVAVCHGFDEAKKAIQDYMLGDGTDTEEVT